MQSVVILTAPFAVLEMDSIKRLISSRAAGCLWLVVICITIAAGIDPKDYPLRNNVEWTPGGTGVSFGKYGVAWTDEVALSELVGGLDPNDLTIEISLENLTEAHVDFGVILVIYGGDPSTQLVLGQWRDQLILMNGDDFSNALATSRLSAKITSPEHLVSMSFDGEIAKLHIDRDEQDSGGGVSLARLSDAEDVRLVVGNSPSRRRSWSGAIRSLAISGRAPESGEDVSFEYAFDEEDGRMASERHGRLPDLKFPMRSMTPESNFLRFPPEDLDISDLTINLIGFMPFGFATYAVVRGSNRRRIALVVLGALVLSFSFECFQYWMPSRVSSLADLVLNTLGALLGALILASWLRGLSYKFSK